VNAGKREKSERGGKPKEWRREGEEEAGEVNPTGKPPHLYMELYILYHFCQEE
jgi:hypothetical protein